MAPHVPPHHLVPTGRRHIDSDGKPIDENSVSDAVNTVLNTIVTAYMAHAVYRSATKA